MAKREVVESDISGKPDATTVTFGLADTWYEIDLTEDEKKKLEATLKTYLSKGRKAQKKGEKKQVVPETTPEEREQIRAWAKEQGFEFAERGRIPKSVQAAYDKAHKIKRSM
ncbi:histone-like nucleoid-structuring protein Lsr2 [Saccharopolyspora hattusasensis]|uniref:histone-like nucleoid-structuring protein Lsr2 n=1 Tax=Saccharopolyspora hattusasensis TaxID=1128679 RepID=UPI003D98513B